MKGKVIFIAMAVIATALLFGGIYLLFRDDVDVVIQKKKIKPYVPDFTILELPNDSDSEEKNTDKISGAVEKKLKEQVQNLCDNFDNSIGWLYVPDTKINYPVMYSGDNDYYLHRAVDGSYLRVGSVFLDYRCNADFTGKINVLYGHNMSDESMFADVVKYIDENYFYSHDTAWLTTADCVYRIEFFSVTQPESSDIIYDISIPLESWHIMLKNRSFIWKDVPISDGDKLISFSTCTDSEGTSRTLLTGKLIRT